MDAFEFRQPRRVATMRALEMCVACHHDEGLPSILSAARLFKPYAAADAGGPVGEPEPEYSKSRRADWGQLLALWRTEPR